MCMSPDGVPKLFALPRGLKIPRRDRDFAQPHNCLGIPSNWERWRLRIGESLPDIFYKLHRLVTYPVFKVSEYNVFERIKRTEAQEKALFDNEPWPEWCLDRCSVAKCERAGLQQDGRGRPICNWHHYKGLKRRKEESLRRARRAAAQKKRVIEAQIKAYRERGRRMKRRNRERKNLEKLQDQALQLAHAYRDVGFGAGVFEGASKVLPEHAAHERE